MTAAVSGSARFVIYEPNAVTVSDVHSFTKSGLRQSPMNARLSVSLSRMSACSFRSFPAMRDAPSDGAKRTGGWVLQLVPACCLAGLQPGGYCLYDVMRRRPFGSIARRRRHAASLRGPSIGIWCHGRA
jgi:hypothetical protein